MGVMSCNRAACESILCERYSHIYGYICKDCLEELKYSFLPISVFMKTPKIEYNNDYDLEQVFENV